MKCVNTATPSSRDTQPLIPRELSTRFVTVYGDDINDEAKAFIDHLLQSSSHLVSCIVDGSQLNAKQVVRRISAELPKDGHLLLYAHGGNVPVRGLNTHHLQLPHRGNPEIATASMIRRIVKALGVAPIRVDQPSRSLPFIYFFSCGSGALREQISPQSNLWKRANLLIFSSSSQTNVMSSGSSVAGAVAYVNHCQRSMHHVDPLKLLFFAGMHRGDCVTLMGGNLNAPLVWHAPKSGEDQGRIDNLTGSPEDTTRFETMLASLTRDEYRLLPAASLTEVFINRITRNDAKRLEELLAAHPPLRDTPALLNTLPLAFAAETQSHDCLLSLLAAGADPDAPDSKGNTALMTAVMYSSCHPDDVEALLDHGASVNLKNNNDLTALMFACREGHADAIRMLLLHDARIDLQDICGDTALVYACRDGRAEAARLLLKAKANPDLPNMDGITPLMWASASGHIDIIHALIQHGADPDLPDYRGDTALTVAAENGHLDAMRLLLEAGAHPDAQRDDGVSALMLAVDKDNAEAVELLLSHGARVDIFDVEGCSALIYAAKDNRPNALKVLLSAGESVAAGLNPALIELTHENGHHETAKLLQQALDQSNAAE